MMKKLLVFFVCLTGMFLFAKEVRIVSLSPSLTELVFRLGAEDMLVGRSASCDEPVSVKKIPVAGAYASPNIEKTASLKPDLILADSLWPPSSEKMLRSLNGELILKKCESLADYREWVTLLGAKLDRKVQAQKECQYIDEALKDFAASHPGKDRRTVWILWADPLIVAGSGTLPESVLSLCGAVNAANGKDKYFRTSFEWLLKTDPDVIIVLQMSGGGIPESLSKHPAWNMLKAVRKGQVIADIPENMLLRPGPRLPEGIRLLRKRFESFR